MLLAAGLGTRLRPWTIHHPKALVPVGGVPMLERVINRLSKAGFDEIVVNVHHFADQIIDFVHRKDFGVSVSVSDESGLLLDTGGGILKAADMLAGGPFLVHNVDILSDASLEELMDFHVKSGNDITLLTSGRESTRKLMFDPEGCLRGWHDLRNDIYRPGSAAFEKRLAGEAFSGIYVMGDKALEALAVYDAGRDRPGTAFPVMDFFLSFPEGLRVARYNMPGLKLLDIGKPASLARASEILEIVS